jgi:monofunctional biosynthetic peptidoglycan transglycosylase
METVWSKKRILTVYLNIAEFGEGIFGVEATVNPASSPLRSQLRPSHKNRFFAVCCDSVDAPRSPWMGLAVIAAEDQKFPEHWGFDVSAIEKALAHLSMATQSECAR